MAEFPNFKGYFDTVEQPDNSEKPVGFKEWEWVCKALGDGLVSLIIRKGGIAEGRGGFDFGRRVFWLFPTFFHHQAEGLKMRYREKGEVLSNDDRETVTVRTRVEITRSTTLTDWGRISALEEFHPWEPAVVRERFEYKGAGLKVALVRAFNLTQPVEIPYEKRLYGGCKSWVEMPPEFADSNGDLRPVISDEEHRKRVGEIGPLLDA